MVCLQGYGTVRLLGQSALRLYSQDESILPRKNANYSNQTNQEHNWCRHDMNIGGKQLCPLYTQQKRFVSLPRKT